MAMNLPHELAWVLQMLDFEWPEIDEDEVARGAQMLRQYGEDLSTCIDRIDRIMHEQVEPAYKTSTGASMTASWDETRSGSMKEFVGLIEPAATGMDLFGAGVVALKLKVIAELVLTAAQIAAAIAAAAFTFGASLAAQTAILMARKMALKFATNVAIEQMMMQIMEMLAEPLMNVGMALSDRIMEAPVVQGAMTTVERYDADLAALEQASSDLKVTQSDQETLTDDFLQSFSSLQISTAG